MALPVITSNSPVAGSITWTACGIVWDGDDYNIGAGSTAMKFVIWRHNNGSPFLEERNDLPTVPGTPGYMTPADKLMFINKGGVGALVPVTDVVDGSMLVTGSVLADSIGANAIDTVHLNANSITGQKIAANAITSNLIAANAITSPQIAAGAITADKLSVGVVSDDMVVNGSFEDALTGNLVGWEISAQSNGTVIPVTGLSSSGAVSIQFDATSTAANLRLRQLPAQYMPVTASAAQKYYVAARLGVSVATTAGNYIRANFYDGNKAFISAVDTRSNAALTTTFTTYDGQVTPPANAKYMGIEILLVSPNVVTKMYLDEVSAAEVTMSAQIGDGQITTPKMVANTINADRLQANTITATQIAGNTITGDRIAARTLTADKILVSDFTNYSPDPSFENGGVGWSLGGGFTIATIADPPVTGTKVAQTIATGAVKDLAGDAIPVRAGDWYYATGYVRKVGGTGGAAGSVQLGATVNTLTGPQWPTFQTVNPSTLTNAWTQLKGAIQMPAGALNLAMRPSVRNDVADGTYQFDDIVLRRMSGGELIVDGTITAAELAADSVTSTAILANTITGTKILAGSVAGDRITANTLAADRIVANSIGATQIAAGAITSNLIASDAILAKHIGIGDFQNLATIDELYGYTVSSYGQTKIAGGYNSLVTDSGTFLMFKDQDGPVPFENGEKLYYSFTAKATTATTANFGVYIYNAAGSNQSTTSASFNIGTTDTAITGSITVPSDDAIFGPAKQYVLGLGNTSNKGIQVKDVFVRRMNNGKLIVDGAITTNHMTTNTINANILAANTITATEIGANVIGAKHIQVNTLNANVLTTNTITGNLLSVNTITGDKIASNAILARSIAVGDFDNLFDNGGFNIGPTGLDNWNAGVGTVVTNANFVSGKGLQNTTIGNYQSRYQERNIVCKDGDQFYLAGKVYSDTAITNAPSIRMMFMNVSGGMISNSGVGIAGTNGVYTALSGKVTAPPLTAYARLWVEFHMPAAGTQILGDLVARRMNGGELIVDGAIKTAHITVNTLSGNVITGNTIAGDKITFNTLSGDRIISNTLDANAIIANTITANHIGANAITTEELGVNVVTAKHIGANVLDANILIANTITALQIQTDAVTAAKIKAGEIQTGHMTANSISADRLVAGSITTTLMTANSIDASVLAANSITATQIAAGAITANLIDANAINGKTITGVEVKTGADAQSGVYAQMGQYMVSNMGAADRPGFGFVDPNSTLPKIGVFSEDAKSLILMGGRGIINGPAESYVTLNKDESWLYNYKEVNIYTSSWSGSTIDINSGGTVSITSTSGPVKLNGNEAQGTSPWQTVSLLNGWAAYTGGGNYYNGLRVRKEGHNVRYQGMIKSGAVGSVICNLPSGYVPRATSFHTIMTSNAGTSRQIGAVLFGVTTPGVSGTLSYDTGLATPTWINIDVAIPLHDG